MLNTLLQKTPLGKVLLRLFLRLHNLSYRYVANIAIRVQGQHPKHRIQRYAQWFSSHVEDDDVVLDIGSNTGAMAGVLAGSASFVYGLEIVPALYNTACSRNTSENLKFLLGDATKFDYSTLRPISIITLSNVLEHIDKRVEFLQTIVSRANWMQHRRKTILIRVPMVDRDWITVYKREMAVDWKLDPTHFTEYTETSFYQEMQSAGVNIVEKKIQFGELYAVCEAR